MSSFLGIFIMARTDFMRDDQIPSQYLDQPGERWWWDDEMEIVRYSSSHLPSHLSSHLSSHLPSHLPSHNLSSLLGPDGSSPVTRDWALARWWDDEMVDCEMINLKIEILYMISQLTISFDICLTTYHLINICLTTYHLWDRYFTVEHGVTSIPPSGNWWWDVRFLSHDFTISYLSLTTYHLISSSTIFSQSTMSSFIAFYSPDHNHMPSHLPSHLPTIIIIYSFLFSWS